MISLCNNWEFAQQWHDDFMLGEGNGEAVRLPQKRFVWAVQWHPEAFWEEEGLNLELFKKLVDAAG